MVECKGGSSAVDVQSEAGPYEAPLTLTTSEVRRIAYTHLANLHQT
jgi:hypothetical protein